MPARTPLVFVNGEEQQLQAADALQGDGSLLGNVNDPGVFCLGNAALYPSVGAFGGSNEQQYTRVWLPVKTTITKMTTYVYSGANGVRAIQFGIYDQATPTDPLGTPQNLVAATLAVAPVSSTVYVTAALSSSYVVPTSGFYWLAMQVDNTVMRFAVSTVFQVGYANRREQTPGSFVLASPAGVTTRPRSSIAFVAAVE